MNSPILWWAARYSRAVQYPRVKPPLFSRLTRAAMAAAMAVSLAPLAVPVQAQNASNQSDAAANASPAPQIKVDSSALPRSTGAITSFAPIVEKVGPSIVTIFTTKNVKEQANPLAGNPMLRRFFGIPDNSGPDGEEGENGKVMGLGSGVIVSADGLILTNNHVAEAGDEIMVRIGEHGHEYKAKVVGNDPSSDLALLRIDAKNLPVLTFADSQQVRVGDLVLAVGSPFGLTNTVTMGIVSALGRGGMGITDYEDFIQTDASINPGNSGGALVDAQGRLVGINTAIYSRSGGNQGIGFAVPSNLAHTVMDSLLKYGKVTRGYLGTRVQDLTPDLAEQFKAPADQEGALIAEATPGGAAAKAGLKNGDIITAINGKPISDPHALRLTIGGMNPGDKVNVTYLRDGQSRTMDVTLGEQTANGEVSENTPPEGKSNVLDGITVGDLDDSARSELKVPSDIKGVLVTDVAADSVGYDAGLRKGDVILEMKGKPLTSSDQAVAEGNKIEKTERVLLHVWSKGRTEYLVLKPKES
jgi:serine protease Do